MQRVYITPLLILCFALTAFTQNDRKATQARLKQFFEGKRVMLKIDMPAARAGVDIYPEKPTVFDISKHAKRLAEYDISLRRGDEPIVTEVEVSGDEIEFQLDGGGYGSPADSSGEPYVPSYPTKSAKSNYEKDLENELKTATDSNRIKTIRRELERERSRRDREYNRDMGEYNRAVRYRDEYRREKRVTRGSRFNIKFDKRQTAGITPEILMDLLGPYIDFSGMTGIGEGPRFPIKDDSTGSSSGGATPYVGDWRSGRGETLRIRSGLIQFGQGTQMEFREVFRMAASGLYAIEIMNPSGNMRRFVSINASGSDLKLAYYDTLDDMQNGINRKGEETWSK
jgi:hypothetical protein